MYMGGLLFIAFGRNQCINHQFSLKNAFLHSENLKTNTLTNVWDKSVDLLNQSLKTDLITNFDVAVQYIEQATSVSILGK